MWLSLVHPSPMLDIGYDVSDYEAIDPRFGTMADFDALVTAMRTRGLKLILDFVPNHTSDQHPWFVESRSSKTTADRRWLLFDRPQLGRIFERAQVAKSVGSVPATLLASAIRSSEFWPR